MQESEIKEKALRIARRLINDDVRNGVEHPVDWYIGLVRSDMGNSPLTVPVDDFMGRFGVVHDITPDEATVERWACEIRPVLSDHLFQRQSAQLAKRIGLTGVHGLIDGALSGKGLLYRTWDRDGDVEVQIDLGGKRFIILTVHCDSSMLSDVDRLLPAVEDAKAMMEKYGRDLKIM